MGTALGFLPPLVPIITLALLGHPPPGSAEADAVNPHVGGADALSCAGVSLAALLPWVTPAIGMLSYDRRAACLCVTLVVCVQLAGV